MNSIYLTQLINMISVGCLYACEIPVKVIAIYAVATDVCFLNIDTYTHTPIKLQLISNNLVCAVFRRKRKSFNNRLHMVLCSI